MDDLNMRFSAGGDIELQEAIDIYGNKLLNYCFNILCVYADAQDAVQEVFIRAHFRRKYFESGTNLSAWLYSIAYHICIDELRKRRRRVFFTPMAPHQHSCPTMSEELSCALQKLNPIERGVVFQRVLEERSYDELSPIYGKSSSALRKIYQRARKKLATELQPDKITEEATT